MRSVRSTARVAQVVTAEVGDQADAEARDGDDAEAGLHAHA
jgi:hypothetical protein